MWVEPDNEARLQHSRVVLFLSTVGCSSAFFSKCWYSRFTSWHAQNFNPRRSIKDRFVTCEGGGERGGERGRGWEGKWEGEHVPYINLSTYIPVFRAGAKFSASNKLAFCIAYYAGIAEC